MTQNKKRILVVDRNPAATEEIERLLNGDEARFILYTAESPLHAIDTVYSEPPDLVIINYSLWLPVLSRTPYESHQKF